MLTSAGWGIRAKEMYVVDLAVDKVGLQIVLGLHSMEAGSVVVVRGLGSKGEV
jgi:hypothetical protein